MNKKQTIIVVEDDKNTRDGICRALQRAYDVRSAEDAAQALKLLAEVEPALMLTDLRMPGEDGLSLLRQALRLRPGLPVIVLTAYGSVETAVEAMKQGAYDFVTKPINLDHLELLVARALRSRLMEEENKALQQQVNEKFGLDNILGNSAAMREVFSLIKQAAPTDATVLIQGASGTGKELVAHALHRLSRRAHGPFIAVHCAALAPALLESELFGHERGAFTGAVAQRKGRFELADGGTLFLDEISEIDPSIQVKLLRVLEERRFERVGGSESIEVNLRIVTATNRDLRQYVAEGKFREDLFFRLNVVDIQLPVLAQRRDDIPLLAAVFLKEFAERNGRSITGFAPEALEALCGYDWPGNVRELRNVIEKMVVLAHGSRLELADVPSALRTAPVVTVSADVTMASDLAGTTRRQILATLKACKGNRAETARKLRIGRRTLYRRLAEYEESEPGSTDVR